MQHDNLMNGDRVVDAGGVVAETPPAASQVDDDAGQPVLWRIMARARGAAAAQPTTPTRVIRVALTRAGERAAGLDATALGVADDICGLADLLGRMEDGWLFLVLEGGMGPGIAAMDPGFLSAVIEAQTRGRLSATAPEPRPATGADAALAEPLFAAFLAELVAGAAETSLDGWADGYRPAARLADLRAIATLLPERDFRVLAMSAWLGAGDRQGQMILALPVDGPKPASAEMAQRSVEWAAGLHANVLSAPSHLDAVLYRMRLPLRAVQQFAIGQVLPLPGVRVTSVRIEGPDGAAVACGRLGQSGGMRAVRVEREPVPELAEVAPDRGVRQAAGRLQPAVRDMIPDRGQAGGDSG